MRIPFLLETINSCFETRTKTIGIIFFICIYFYFCIFLKTFDQNIAVCNKQILRENIPVEIFKDIRWCIETIIKNLK